MDKTRRTPSAPKPPANWLGVRAGADQTWSHLVFPPPPARVCPASAVSSFSACIPRGAECGKNEFPPGLLAPCRRGSLPDAACAAPRLPPSIALRVSPDRRTSRRRRRRPSGRCSAAKPHPSSSWKGSRLQWGNPLGGENPRQGIQLSGVQSKQKAPTLARSPRLRRASEETVFCRNATSSTRDSPSAQRLLIWLPEARLRRPGPVTRTKGGGKAGPSSKEVPKRPFSDSGPAEGNAEETPIWPAQRTIRPQGAGRAAMEGVGALRFWLMVCGCLAFPSRAESVCPERCDCQHPQHLLCTNRGLRAVPKTSSLPSPQDVLTYSLGGNFITNITAFDFHRLGQLKRLDLQYNQIRSLHPKTFEKLSRLEELYLGNNLLQAFSPGTLAPLRKLRILYANGNEIGRLSRGSFEGLESLVKLRLDGNVLGALPDAVFAPLGNLLYLHLESNRIRFLGKNAFTQLGKLRFLNLSANELQPSLRHAATFVPLRSLSTLILSSNNLQHLGPRVFQHLPRLGLLSLSGNQLTQLAPEAFWGLESLRELHLEGNRLSQLPLALLEPLHSLEALDLSGNELSALHPATFGHQVRLRELSLRDNALRALSGDIFAASPALYRLDLDGNGWTCDCRLRGLKRWMGDWHSQGRLLTVFVQCRHPPALRGKYLDYLDDQLLQNGSCLDPSPSPTAGSRQWSLSTATGEGMTPPTGGLAQELPPQPQPQQRGRLLPGVAWGGAAKELMGNRSSLRLNRRGPSLQRQGLSTAAASGPASQSLDLQEKPERGRPTRANLAQAEPTPTAEPASGTPSARDSWQRASKQRLASEQQERVVASDGGVGLPPLVSDPCDFNKFVLCNLTVETVSANSASVRWAVREHRSPRPQGGARFRLLFDRFGQQPKFQRFVYLPERSDSATLHELRGDTPYLVCVEGVLGGRVCPVAPRDHCAGLVTLPETGVRGGVDYQLLTLVLLAVNALLVLLALAAWGSRWLRRKLRARRKGGAPVHVRHMYSTRRPLRSMGTGVSADFSGFQSHRPRTTVCALSEADLIEFPCDRFMDSTGGGASGSLRREDHLLQRFAD